MRYVQHYECSCGERFSGPVTEADRWSADHLNAHDGPAAVAGRMTSLRPVPQSRRRSA